MNPLIPILLYAAAYALLFVTWAAVVFLKVPGADNLVQYIQITLGGLTGHVLTLIDPRRATTPAQSHVTKQAGFTSLCMLFVLVVVALALSGCASVQQAVQAYGSVAVTGARAASDTLIEAQKVSLCGLPLSAIARHPEVVPAVRSLCLAPGDKTSADLLDAVQASQPASKS